MIEDWETCGTCGWHGPHAYRQNNNDITLPPYRCTEKPYICAVCAERREVYNEGYEAGLNAHKLIALKEKLEDE